MLGKRTVAFLDILGFKDFLYKESLEKLSEKYTRIVDITEGLNKDLYSDYESPKLFSKEYPFTNWCIKRIFSDSIILFANDDSEESCLRLLIYIWRLIQACLSVQMPFRGGVAFDELYIDESREIFLGKALTKAYELEGCQNWIGIAIHENIPEIYPTLFHKNSKPFLNNIFLKYPVPFKGGARKELYTINWRFNFIAEKGTRALMPYSLDKYVIEKVENTLKYAKKIVESGKLYIQRQDLAPIELRAFYCGDKEPPYPHGDDL